MEPRRCTIQNYQQSVALLLRFTWRSPAGRLGHPKIDWGTRSECIRAGATGAGATEEPLLSRVCAGYPAVIRKSLGLVTMTWARSRPRRS